MKDVLNFLAQYWGLILLLIGIIWAQIKFYFDFKYFKKDTVPEIFKQMSSLEAHLIQHDKEDFEMKKSLTELIDRNKTTTEATAKETQSTLNLMGQDLAVVKNNINLLLKGNLKPNSDH